MYSSLKLFHGAVHQGGFFKIYITNYYNPMKDWDQMCVLLLLFSLFILHCNTLIIFYPSPFADVLIANTYFEGKYLILPIALLDLDSNSHWAGVSLTCRAKKHREKKCIKLRNCLRWWVQPTYNAHSCNFMWIWSNEDELCFLESKMPESQLI